MFALYHECLCRDTRVCGTPVDLRCRVVLCSQVATAWMETKRDHLFARLRLLFDFLQVTGLLMAMWYVTLLLCCTMHPYVADALQSVISGLSGAAIGGGLSVSTRAPY